MLNRLLLRNQSLFLLTVALLGAITGFYLLLTTIQAYLDFKELLTSKSDLIRPEYVVINKRVSVFSTLKIANTTFSEKEIDEIKMQPFVQKVGVFTSNAFAANAFVERGESSVIPAMYTDLFFEAVPNEYIDVKSAKWRWREGDSIVPVILPSDYLKLYNFGFAPSQNLPVISEKMVEIASFNIRIKGKEKQAVFRGRIAGLSDRINSILVPQNFMEYANRTFAPEVIKEPSRLILVSDNPSSPELAKYLEDEGFQTNEETLRNSKLNTVLRIIVFISVFLGAVILALAVMVFILYGQVIIFRSSYEIKTLIQLGFPWFKICLRYMVFYLVLFTVVLGTSLYLLSVSKDYFKWFMKDRGFDISDEISGDIFGYGLILLGIFLLLNSVSVLLNVRKLAKPGS